MKSINVGVAVALLATAAASQAQTRDPTWRSEFALTGCTMSDTGRNPFFILEPGFQLVLQDGGETLQVTVLDETRTVDGVPTRVVEEREWKGEQLYEVSNNYFAICPETGDVYYFGEEVNFYEGQQVVRHDGSWLAGEKGAKAGLIMPGAPNPGMRYYQEMAPEVAMDRAEIVSLEETCETTAGSFPGCLKIKEGTALEPALVEYKFYAPNIGLVQDEDLRLVRYGFVESH